MEDIRALLILDVQNDFCFGGPLEVPGADQIVEPINMIMRDYECVVATQDWHPEGHFSFASEHPEKAPFDTVPWQDSEQVLWPDHCVAGTDGAALHPDLDTEPVHLIIRKGFDPMIDSYSAFYENDHDTSTGLAGYLKEKDITAVDICGLAADVCVYFTAIDALACGFSVRLIRDCVRGIDQPKGSMEERMQDLKRHGVKFI